MNSELGTLSELPTDYREAMAAADVAPLWPMMRNLLPYDKPSHETRIAHWKFETIRPLLLKAGELTPVHKAERRVLVLSDPGRGGGAMQATPSIYVGMQLILPGEVAPLHRHTPSAARIAVEGKGGVTIVDGEALPMEPGDLILTPGGKWHEHVHEGTEPVIWLDALDLPLLVYLESSYAEEKANHPRHERPDASQVEYLSPGIVPVRSPEKAPLDYPMMRYPWKNTEAALNAIEAVNGNVAPEIAYVNPESGSEVLPTLGFTATKISAGVVDSRPVQSSSAVFYVVKGSGQSSINGKKIIWHPKDVFSAPGFAEISHHVEKGEAFLIRIHDRPLQEKLGYYEERMK